jgi:hypothetical protein
VAALLSIDTHRKRREKREREREEMAMKVNLRVKRDVAHGLLDLSDNLPLRAGVEVVASMPQQSLQIVCHVPVFVYDIVW